MTTPHEYNFGGCKLKFPAKAYPSQVAMMSKIITSIQRSQNSLLESPTGSGKSLALLCGALAWQEKETRKVDDFNALLEQATVNQDPALRDALIASAGPDGVEYDEEDNFTLGPRAGQPDAAAVAMAKSASLGEDTGGGFIPDEDDDFKQPAAKRQKIVKMDESSGLYHLPPDQAKQIPGSEGQFLRLPKRKRVPQIYFGTRTHKQVAQIVRELKKTAYSGVRMTILGARDHTCIHPTVSKSFNKNQDCAELLDRKKGLGCRFQANVKQKLQSHNSLRVYLGHQEAWDLEDLVKVGKKVKACPYFASRELKQAAQIIFCPYNYLTDWKIRKAMQISLKNQIVVLDEAHNIEDCAREASSGKWALEDVTHAIQDLEKMAAAGVEAEAHTGLANFCSRLAVWMDKCSKLAPDYTDFTTTSKVWSGTAGLAELNTRVFDETYNYHTINPLVQTALKERSLAMENNDGDGGGEENGPTLVLARGTADLLEGLMNVLGFMIENDHKHRDDFRVAVSKAQVRKKGGPGVKGWMGKGDQNGTLEHKVTLALWCLNPAVCFTSLKDQCRSIILTSGTLSPMVSFASELDVKFSVQLEAAHVIDRKQVFVGTISHGPTGHNLNATYRNTSTYDFQDELGRLVSSVCQTIKHGVLVFFPSYKMLNDLTMRWQNTGLWTTISASKSIVTEPRYANEFDASMKMFYSIIKDTNQGPLQNGQDGALFLAVCRGKVSEGMDFADNNARAVICVGIPFPNVKDPLVDLKKKYNDQRRTREPTILSGGDWYEIQAFRALNQALGRCIRHKRDWGAILMVDDRFGKNKRYVEGLSKWVRKMVVHYNQFSGMNEQLKQFSADMEQMDKFNEAADVEEKIKRDLETQEKDKLAMDKADRSSPENDSNYFPENASDTSPTSAWGQASSKEASATLASKVAKLKAMSSSSESNLLFKKSAESKNLDSTTHLGFGSHMDNTTHLGTNSHQDSKSNPGSSQERYIPKPFLGTFKEPIDQSEQEKSKRKMKDRLNEFKRDPEPKRKRPSTLMEKDILEEAVDASRPGYEAENGFDGYNERTEESSSSFKFMTGKRNKKTGEKMAVEMHDPARDIGDVVNLYNSAPHPIVKQETVIKQIKQEAPFHKQIKQEAPSQKQIKQEASSQVQKQESTIVVPQYNPESSKKKIRDKLKMFERTEETDSSTRTLPKDMNSAQPKERYVEYMNENEIDKRIPVKYDNDFISANAALVKTENSNLTDDKTDVPSSSKTSGSESSGKTTFTFSKFEKQKSEDKALENLLRSRRESGGKIVQPKLDVNNDELFDSDDEFLQQFDLIKPVPDDKRELENKNDELFDSDEDFFFTVEAESVAKSPSPILSRKKPTVTGRKPLFAKSTNVMAASSNLVNISANHNVASSKPVLMKESGIKLKAVGGPGSKMQYFSSDEEDVQPVKQIKPSLESADEIEEEPEIQRKVKQRRLSRKNLPKKSRKQVTPQSTNLSFGEVQGKREPPPVKGNSKIANQSFQVNSDGFTEVYTDGACSNNGRPNAAAGVGVWWGVDNPINTSKPVDGDKHTNNTAEIQAATTAISQAVNNGIKKLLLHTDSQFVIDCVTKWMGNWKRNGWMTAAGKPVKNKEDLVALDAALKSGTITLKWNHVRGHAGNLGNEEADKLAVKGANLQKKKCNIPVIKTETSFVLDSDDDFV